MTRWICVAVVAMWLAACGGVNSSRTSQPETGTLGPVERTPNAPAPGACNDVPLFTLDQLAQGMGAGQLIAVDGVPKAQVVCTLLDCSNRQCCNRCGGGYVLRDTLKHVVRLMKVGVCSGMDCNLDCKPFGRKPTKSYRFVGKHEYSPKGKTSIYAKSMIHVVRYCRTK